MKKPFAFGLPAFGLLILSGLFPIQSIADKPTESECVTSSDGTVSDTSDYFIKPRVVVVPNQKMLIVTLKGDPEKVAGHAFETLYRYFYKHADGPTKKEAPVPRARWSLAFSGEAKSSWIGEYGLPVPEDFPAPTDGSLRIEVWKYGLVAEILHVGPYSQVTPSVDRLKDFIRSNAYGVIGEYEEEYLVGPGMFFKGNPERYRTLIRLRLGKDFQEEPIAGTPNVR